MDYGEEVRRIRQLDLRCRAQCGCNQAIDCLRAFEEATGVLC